MPVTNSQAKICSKWLPNKMIIRNFDTTLALNTQLSEVIAALEVIEVKGVNDDTQSMIMRNEELPCGV